MSYYKRVNLWQKLMFLLGLFSGVANVIFWVIQISFHSINQEEKFFGDGFQKRTYYWGIAMIALTIVWLLINVN